MSTAQVSSDDAESSHSMIGSASTEAMVHHIGQQIKDNDGWLSFEQYMHEVLYAPNLGYYSTSLPKFGEQGDFITAPELGDAFGTCLARQAAQVLEQCKNGCILEFGAGSGALAISVLRELNEQGAMPKHYYILELSADLRARQARNIEQQLGVLANCVQWLDVLPDAFEGVVLANEVLDAMPVKLFTLRQGKPVEELGVSMMDNENLRWQAVKMPEHISKVVERRCEHLVDPEGYQSELGLQGEAWVSSVAQILTSGALLLVDYGFNQATYYHPDRAQGTLMCHYQHHANPDPLHLSGLQDITAHVNFTAIADAAMQQGLELGGYGPQAQFLLALGLLEQMPSIESEQAQLAYAQEIKKLTMPHEMGELFKVLALTKNINEPLLGFAMLNHANRLWT